MVYPVVVGGVYNCEFQSRVRQDDIDGAGAGSSRMMRGKMMRDDVEWFRSNEDNVRICREKSKKGLCNSPKFIYAITQEPPYLCTSESTGIWESSSMV